MDGQDRILRERHEALEDTTDRTGPKPIPGTQRRLVQVYNAGKIALLADHYFACHPVTIDGTESEGSSDSPGADALQTMIVLFLYGPPAVGDLAVAHAIGDRWIAQLQGAPPCTATVVVRHGTLAFAAAPGSPTATNYTLTGSVTGSVPNQVGSFTVTPSGTVTDTVTIVTSGSPAGSTSVATLTWASSSAAKTFTYTPAVITGGVETIGLISTAGYSVIGSPASYTTAGLSSASVAFTNSTTGTNYTLTGSITISSTSAGEVANFTLTPTGAFADTVTVSIAGAVGNPATLTVSFPGGSSAPRGFSYTPPSGGLGLETIMATSSHGYTVIGSVASYTGTGVSGADWEVLYNTVSLGTGTTGGDGTFSICIGPCTVYTINLTGAATFSGPVNLCAKMTTTINV